MFEIDLLVGSIVPAGVIALILYFTARAWPASWGKVFYVNVVALLLMIGWSAIGAADGGPPNLGRRRSILPRR